MKEFVHPQKSPLVVHPAFPHSNDAYGLSDPVHPPLAPMYNPRPAPCDSRQCLERTTYDRRRRRSRKSWHNWGRPAAQTAAVEWRRRWAGVPRPAPWRNRRWSEERKSLSYDLAAPTSHPRRPAAQHKAAGSRDYVFVGLEGKVAARASTSAPGNVRCHREEKRKSGNELTQAKEGHPRDWTLPACLPGGTAKQEGRAVGRHKAQSSPAMYLF